MKIGVEFSISTDFVQKKKSTLKVIFQFRFLIFYLFIYFFENFQIEIKITYENFGNFDFQYKI